MKRRAKQGPPRARISRKAAAAIADAIAVRGLTEELREERVVAEWLELAGERIARRARPLGIDHRVLKIEVSSAAWMHELSLLKPRLLADLLARLGEPRMFDDLKLVLAGRAKPGPAAPKPRIHVVPPAPVNVAATGPARAAIERDVAAVDDPELRALIAQVRIKNGR